MLLGPQILIWCAARAGIRYNWSSFREEAWCDKHLQYLSCNCATNFVVKNFQLAERQSGQVLTANIAKTSVNYGEAVLWVAVAALCRWAIGKWVGQVPPFITFYPAVMAAAIVGGAGPGVLASILSALAADFFFMEPVGQLGPVTLKYAVQILLFLFINIGISIAGGRLRAAYGQSQVQAVALESAANAIVITNPQGVIEWVNPAFERLTGYTSTEAVGHTPGLLKSGRQDQAFFKQMWETITSGKVWHGELVNKRKDGTLYYEEMTITPVKDSAGKLSRFIAVKQDVNERRKTEDALRRSEATFRGLFDRAAVPTAVQAPDGRVLRANQPYCQFLGYSEEELRALTVADITHPEDRPETAVMKQRLLAGEVDVYHTEKRYLHRDGHILWGQLSVSIVRDAENRPSHFIVQVQDITERKQAEAALREQIQLAHLRADATQALQEPAAVRTLLQNVATLLVERLDSAFARAWTLDKTGKMLELQASAGLYTHLNGAHSRVPVGQFKIGRIAQERRPLFTNQVVGDPQVPDQDWARREGLVAFAGAPLVLEGQLLGVVALFSRHALSLAGTEAFLAVAGVLAQALGRKKAEENLAELNRRLELKVQDRTARLSETIQELEGFSYSLVHDMRAPLRAMQAYASMLERQTGPRLDSGESDLLRKIKVAANRMDQLVTDSLNYSRILREDYPLGPVNIGTLLRDIVDTYPNLQPPAAEIRVELDDVIVQGNQAALTQVFSNLLGNAVKFVAPAVKPRVRIWAELLQARPPEAADLAESTPVPQPRVLVWVEDNGIGIPQNAQEKIFGMFERLHRADEYPGTGVGLALVRKSLDRTGGQICLESEPGRGSRFCVQLPLAAPGAVVAEINKAA